MTPKIKDELSALLAVAAVASGIAGLSAVAYGLYLAWPPLSWVFIGLVLWRGARQTAREQKR